MPIQRMHCPVCGAEMNPHAEKVITPRTRAEALATDWALGGVVTEIHQCPRCGGLESRLSRH